MAIWADVVNGKLDYDYTNSGEKKQPNGSNLDYDAFLQLLCAEMQYQDPLEPTSNTEYVAQLATFSQLEATLSMQDSVKDSLTATQTSLANDLVGKNVIVVDDKSPTGFSTGVVDYIMYGEDGEIYISVENKNYPISALDTVSTPEYYEATMMAGTFKSMMAALPDVKDTTIQYKNAIKELRDFYDGLTDYQKKFIDEKDLAKLKEYETKMEELAKEAEKDKVVSEDTETTTDGEASDELETGATEATV